MSKFNILVDLGTILPYTYHIQTEGKVTYTDYLFYLKDCGSFIVKTNFKNDAELKDSFIMWAMEYGFTKEQIEILMNIGYAYYSTDLVLPKKVKLEITLT